MKGCCAPTDDFVISTRRPARSALSNTSDQSGSRERVGIALVRRLVSEGKQVARLAGRDFGRGDYRRLLAAGLTNATAIEAASDATVLEKVGNDQDKLRLVRIFADSARLREREKEPLPALEPYQA
jgi:hypothetical protein